MTKIIDACKTVNKKVVVPFIDFILSYTISKKLTVFFFATFFLYFDKISGDQWVNIVSIYIGVQSLVDITKEITYPRNNKDLR